MGEDRGRSRCPRLLIFIAKITIPSTYDHRILRTRLPVRSAIFKQDTGGLVVRWVTTGEFPLLYVIFCWCECSDVGLWRRDVEEG
jgi:hypothetical protein